MIINKSEFITSAVRREQYPEDGLNEVAFVGRSNVGKSSIINALTNRRKLAKVSQTPGKTKLINFFLINDAFYLVDLPGYGYAKVSKKEQESWGKTIETYLLHPFPCLGVYDRLVVVLENHLLFQGIFYTVLDFVRELFCLEVYQTARVLPVFKGG